MCSSTPAVWNTFYTRLLCAENNVPRDGPRSETREPEPDCPRPIDAREWRAREIYPMNDARVRCLGALTESWPRAEFRF